jgi:hypothetical protein
MSRLIPSLHVFHVVFPERGKLESWLQNSGIIQWHNIQTNLRENRLPAVKFRMAV